MARQPIWSCVKTSRPQCRWFDILHMRIGVHADLVRERNHATVRERAQSNPLTGCGSQPHDMEYLLSRQCDLDGLVQCTCGESREYGLVVYTEFRSESAPNVRSDDANAFAIELKSAGN